MDVNSNGNLNLVEHHRKLFTPGIWLVVLASILWSTSGFFTQTSLLNVWPAEARGSTLAFWRACFALLLLLPMVRKPSWHWAMIPMTLCFAVMNWTFLSALVVSSPANAIWFQNLSPGWVMLGAVVIFREKTTERDWAMLSMCIAGVAFILVMESLYGFRAPEYRWWGSLLAIASGVCYAGVVLSIRSLRGHESAWLIALNHLVTAFAMLPLVWMSGVSMPSGWMWFLLMGIGMFQMGLPYLLFANGLKTTPSHLAAMITLLEPVLLPVWVHLTRMGDPNYQPPQWWTWVGAGCILLGLSIRYALPALTSTKASED
jgi:drug/metabolite transporter (DMT)-like permease